MLPASLDLQESAADPSGGFTNLSPDGKSYFLPTVCLSPFLLPGTSSTMLNAPGKHRYFAALRAASSLLLQKEAEPDF